jgi:hypothetical protein
MTTTVAAPKKEPFFFQPAGRIFLTVLAVLSCGYFLAPLIGSARRAVKTNLYLFTLIFGIWINLHFHIGLQGFVTFAATLSVMALFTKPVVPLAVESTVQYNIENGVDLATKFTLPEADASGNSLTFFLKAKSQVQVLQKAQKARITGLTSFYLDMKEFDRTFPTLELGDDTDAEVGIFTAEGCSLFEPRKGPTVTQRETQSGARPFIGTKVGPIFVGGSGRSTSHSTSISTPGEDVVQEVDNGNVVVSTRSASFIGAKYTRHVDFKTLIAAHGEDAKITFADSKRTTIWGIAFPSRVSMWIVNTIIGAADELSARRLDTSGKATIDELQSALKKQVDNTREQLLDFYLSAYREFDETNDQLREYHRVYPNQVADPGPSRAPAQATTDLAQLAPPSH